MADAALAASSRAATNVSRVDRSSARGPVAPVRPVAATDAFKRNLNSGSNPTSLTAPQEQPSGSGLLSTGVQMVLAETRTQEAGAPFVPPSNVGRALNSYLEVQAKVRETIRDSLASSAGAANKTTPSKQLDTTDEAGASASQPVPAAI